MPVPAKELGVLGLSLYTCGGAAHPDGSCTAFPAAAPPKATGAAALVANAPLVWARIEADAQQRIKLHGLAGRRRN